MAAWCRGWREPSARASWSPLRTERFVGDHLSEPRPTRLERLLVLATVFVFVLGVLFGESSDGVRNQQPAGAGPPSLTHADIARIARRVERLRGLRFRSLPRIDFASPQRAQGLIRSASERDYPERTRLVDEEVLKLLGLLRPSDDLEQALTTIAREQVIGFYDERNKRLVVVRERGSSSSLQEIVLAHELTHALEDQRFDFRVEGGLGDDGSLARRAVLEGTATVLMADYAERYLGPGEILGVLGSIAHTETKLPRYVERSLLFPYLAGEKFVREFRRGTSWKAVDKLFRIRLPSSTEQVLHPDKYALDEPPSPASLPAVASRLGRVWRREVRSAVGEFDLGALFGLVGNVDDPAAATGWSGGRFELWRRPSEPGCHAPCIARDLGVLRVRWDTERDRAEGESAFRRTLEGGLEARPIVARAGLGLWESRGGAIAMLSGRRSTTIAMAPNAALAASVARAAAP